MAAKNDKEVDRHPESAFLMDRQPGMQAGRQAEGQTDWQKEDHVWLG
jgi:hypothetical protein